MMLLPGIPGLLVFRAVFPQVGLGLYLSVEIPEIWKLPFSSKALHCIACPKEKQCPREQ